MLPSSCILGRRARKEEDSEIMMLPLEFGGLGHKAIQAGKVEGTDEMKPQEREVKGNSKLRKRGRDKDDKLTCHTIYREERNLQGSLGQWPWNLCFQKHP
jgi:hypothetical protein